MKEHGLKKNSAQNSAGYGGDVSPQTCWDSLNNDGAVLIDVRTNVECSFIGVPLLDAHMRPFIAQEWQVFPHIQVDEQFSDKLVQRLQQAGVSQQDKLFFLCRTGGRSLAAARAMAAIGYHNSYNVVGGFEGDCDENKHRGTVNGWKAAGLPWMQT